MLSEEEKSHLKATDINKKYERNLIMRKKITACFIGIGLLAFTHQVFADEIETNIQASRAVVKDFMGSLKKTLVHSMQEGGAVNAISSCNIKAPEISKEKSQIHNMEIGRTSLQVRNELNKPDQWELSVLNAFEERKSKGEAVKKMEYAEIVTIEGKQFFRYMKAIPTGKVCLNCHGSSIKNEVGKKLDELYPNDKARGFQEGDIRGAFTITKPL